MTDNFEVAIRGWVNIARMFNCSQRTMMRRRDDLRRHAVIFYRVEGRPPRKYVYAFPSLLKAWMIKKASEGNNF